MTRPDALPLTENQERRFRSYLSRPDANGCVLWFGPTDAHGYGQFSIPDRRPLRRYYSVFIKAHRLAYALANGPTDRPLTHRDTCPSRLCCNPDHLVPVPARRPPTGDVHDADSRHR